MATVVGACDCVCCCDQDGVCRYDVTVSVTANGSYADPGDPTAVGHPPNGASSSTAWSKTDVVEGECNRVVFSLAYPCIVNWSFYSNGPGGEEPGEFCEPCPDDLDPFGAYVFSSGCSGYSCRVVNQGGQCNQINTVPIGPSGVEATVSIQNGELVVHDLVLSVDTPYPQISASSNILAHFVGSASVTFKGKTKIVNLYSNSFFPDLPNGSMSVSINVQITQRVGS